ncbi:MAG TPA: hypothetical protein VIT89_04145 [Solirubrobacterales bacterium]
MKTVRTLGAAGILAVALTVLLGAGSALAAQFQAPSYPVSLTGEASSSPALEMKTESGVSKCTKVSLSGTASGASSAVSVAPSYSSCKAFGLNATAVTNSCSYVLNSTNENHPFTGKVDIACTKGGDAMEIVATGIDCRVKIPAQTGLAGAAFDNSGASFKSTLSLSGVKYSEVGASCASPGEHTTSTFVSNFWTEGVRLASLEAPKFEAESYPSFVGGSGNVTMSGNFGTINCYPEPEGTLSGSASSLNIAPRISGCAFSGAKFSVSDNDCSFALNAITDEFPYAPGTLGIGCGKAGSALTFTIPLVNCKVRIPAQAAANSLAFESIGAGTTRSVNVGMAVSGLTYTEEAGGGCSSPGAHNNLALTGGLNLKGYKSVGGVKGGQQGLWIG